MKVKNQKNTADKSCLCGAWLEHWKKHTSDNTEVVSCGVLVCTELAAVGAHVIKVDQNDQAAYIVPMCHSHNLQLGEELVIGVIEHVTAQETEDCG